MNGSLIQQYDEFAQTISQARVAENLGPEKVSDSQDLGRLLNTYITEGRVALSMIEPCLSKSIRILEVGAGLCILSLFLRSRGYNITALEPGAGGFSFFDEIRMAILSANPAVDLLVLEIAAQDLDPDTHGHFDLIFSNNVLEHIPELSSAFVALSQSLSPDGVMLHNCPNYLVPYEPHVGLPVVKFWPGLTRILWRQRIDDQSEMWDSLNYIDYFQVRRLASRVGLRISFTRHVMLEAMRRIDRDPDFARRHADTTAGKIYRLLVRLRLINLLKLLPPAMSTPMVFELSHRTQLRERQAS